MINTIILLLTMHWVSDFILQSDQMAKNKSSSLKWLAIHVAVYIIPFFLFGWVFALVNGVLHFAIDFFTSKLNKYLWDRQRVHWFFVGVGFDQLLHAICLLVTFDKLIGG